MSKLQMLFLDVGHGDCTYLELPNGARMMIDCGGGEDNWPSKVLEYVERTKENGVITPSRPNTKYGLNTLVISHPHGDHLSDIERIHDDISFRCLVGGYKDMIDSIKADDIDWRHSNVSAVKKFIAIVKDYTQPIPSADDTVSLAVPTCVVKYRRFINTYTAGMDLNELSWLVSVEIGGHKILFTGDMTADGVKKILASPQAEEFKAFVKGTTILKVPHHGRKNGCSQEMFNAFGRKPLICIVSDEMIGPSNEDTEATGWYCERTSDEKVNVDNVMQARKVLTTRKDKDMYILITEQGELTVQTDCFANVREQLRGQKMAGVA